MRILGLRFSTTSPPRSHLSIAYGHDDTLFSLRYAYIQGVDQEYANKYHITNAIAASLTVFHVRPLSELI